MDRVPARPLGTFERAQYLTGERFAYNLVVSLHLRGAVSAAGLQAALEDLQRRHPLLRCAIHRRGKRPVFELGPDRAPIPVRRVERLDNDTWKAEVEAELALPFETRRAPLVRVAHVVGDPGSERHELQFTFAHALVDGAAALSFLRGVLAAAGRPAGPSGTYGAGLDRASSWASTFPPSADDRLPACHRGLRALGSSGRFLARQMAEEIAYRWRTRGQRSMPPAGPFHCRVLPLAFGEEETSTLVRATRRRRVSVWSALNAALLLAVVGRRYPGSCLPHRFFAFPMLRSYLSPPIPDDVVASYTSVMRLALPVDHDAELWTLAAAIHRQSDRAAKRGEKFLSARWSALSMKAILSQSGCRMGTAALSYAGAVDLAADGAPFAVEGLHAFVSNFPIGPEYTAQARIFRRRLWLDFVYLDSDMNEAEASAIAGDLRALLAASAARVGEEPA